MAERFRRPPAWLLSARSQIAALIQTESPGLADTLLMTTMAVSYSPWAQSPGSAVESWGGWTIIIRPLDARLLWSCWVVRRLRTDRRVWRRAMARLADVMAHEAQHVLSGGAPEWEARAAGVAAARLWWSGYRRPR